MRVISNYDSAMDFLEKTKQDDEELVKGQYQERQHANPEVNETRTDVLERINVALLPNSYFSAVGLLLMLSGGRVVFVNVVGQ